MTNKTDSHCRSEVGGFQQSPPPQSGDSSSPTRFDSPHEFSAPASETAAEGGAPAAPPSEETVGEQLRLQAAQLAEHLRRRQKELDDREAAFNSRLARWESEIRSTRLRLDQREADLSIADAALARERQKLAARSAALDERDKESARLGRIISERERAAARRGRDSSRSQRETKERLERLAAAEAAQLRERQSAAKRDEQLQRREEIAQRRDAERRRATAELKRRRQSVGRRAEQVEKSRAALEQLREELTRMHRETLEIRLATEELWARLSGAAPPAELTRSLGRIRNKLAEQYAQANAELAERKKQLETLRVQLLEQHDKLLERKRRFDRWVAARGRECETQSSRLLSREEQLQREEAHIREQSQRWHAERLKYRRQMRRLKAICSPRRREAIR